MVIVAGLATGALQAQNCKTPSASAPWLLVQKQTLSEEDGAWKNDSLRKALLTAAGMKSAAVSVQLGWEDNGAPTGAPSPSVDYLKSLAATRGSAWPTRS